MQTRSVYCCQVRGWDGTFFLLLFFVGRMGVSRFPTAVQNRKRVYVSMFEFHKVLASRELAVAANMVRFDFAGTESHK